MENLQKEKSATVKIAQERAVEIYARLAEGQRFNCSNLVEEFGVSLRAIQRNIEIIRKVLDKGVLNGGGWQSLYFDRLENTYKMDPPIRNLLDKREVFAVIKVLLESRGFNNEEMKKLIDKLVNCCVAPNERIDFYNQINREFVSYVEPKHSQKVIDDVWELEDAVHKRKVVEICYKRKDGMMVGHFIMPVALMFSEFYFYVIAYIKSEKLDNIPIDKRFPTVFRVDRITYKKVLHDQRFTLEGISSFSESEIRKRVQFMYGGPLRKIRFYCLNESVEAALDRLPTAHVVSKDDTRSLIEAEVYGDGVDMWLRSQGDRIEII